MRESDSEREREREREKGGEMRSEKLKTRGRLGVVCDEYGLVEEDK